jgi:hypothetical protein
VSPEKKKRHGAHSCHFHDPPLIGTISRFEKTVKRPLNWAIHKPKEKPETDRENRKNKTGRNNWLKPMTHNL